MSLWNERVDRFFVGKVIFGLVCIFNLLAALDAVFTIIGIKHPIIPISPIAELISSLITAGLAYLLFRWVEKRRIAAIN